MSGKSRRVLSGGRRPVLRKASRREWTPRKRARFIEELAATCNVTAAARAVRMSTVGAYRLRARDAAFRAEWALALREGYVRLEMVLLERSMNGTVKTIARGDGRVDKIKEYPNHLAFQLLKLHRQTVAETDAMEREEDLDEVRARLAMKLDALRIRIEAEKGQGA
jgi:hypothetical protein